LSAGFTVEWTASKVFTINKMEVEQTNYDWVLNWLYSQDANYEVSPCKPPYDDFDNMFCKKVDESMYVEVQDENFEKYKEWHGPMIFKCFVGLLPFYCPEEFPKFDF
jgi:hypothetical protein